MDMAIVKKEEEDEEVVITYLNTFNNGGQY
jgi:hypothetical protein